MRRNGANGSSSGVQAPRASGSLSEPEATPEVADWQSLEDSVTVIMMARIRVAAPTALTTLKTAIFGTRRIRLEARKSARQI